MLDSYKLDFTCVLVKVVLLSFLSRWNNVACENPVRKVKQTLYSHAVNCNVVPSIAI